MHADSSNVLSSHSVIALTRCSSLHGSILKRFVPNHKAILERMAISAAQCAAQPLPVAAHAQPCGEKQATPAHLTVLLVSITETSATSPFQSLHT